jgi:predicted Rossmann fold nucleotide-binding protein DprA/Smf involved in DNA uptake
MKLAVVGSRDFNDRQLAFQVLDKIHTHNNIEQIVSGGARGADSIAAEWAKTNSVDLLEFLPEWDKHGKSAGYKRNVLIVRAADVVLAFWDGVSKGTKHSIDIAGQQGKKVYVVKDGKPVLYEE